MDGDEAPRPKDFMIVLTAVAILVVIAWIAYFIFKIR